MEWAVETDLAAYGARVLPWLQRDPVLNTVPATVLVARLDGTVPAGRPWLAWLRDPAGAVAGIALRTPPRGLLVSVLPPEAVGPLAAAAPAGLPGVAGRADVAAAVARAYAARSGGVARVALASRLYRFGRPVPTPRPAGRLRPAGAADIGLCVRWFAEFGAESGVTGTPDAAAVAGSVARGRLLLWETTEPVALVGHSPTVAGVTRVSPVWTPPEHRRRGYATAATAEVAAALRKRGEVVLYADLANPTSPGIYLRIGFRPVAEWADWVLEY